MKIFLKILGVIFASLITGVFAAGLFVVFCNCNINAAIQLLNEGNYETYVAAISCTGLGLFFVFSPVIFEINRKIEDKYY